MKKNLFLNLNNEISSEPQRQEGREQGSKEGRKEESSELTLTLASLSTHCRFKIMTLFSFDGYQWMKHGGRGPPAAADSKKHKQPFVCQDVRNEVVQGHIGAFTAELICSWYWKNWPRSSFEPDTLNRPSDAVWPPLPSSSLPSFSFHTENINRKTVSSDEFINESLPAEAVYIT